VAITGAGVGLGTSVEAMATGGAASFAMRWAATKA
jgi:hypothetical protein